MGAIADWVGRGSAAADHRPGFCVRDCLHGGRTAHVSGDMVAEVVASWLAEFDAVSPAVDDLARAVCDGDWPSAHALAARLSVEIEVDVEADVETVVRRPRRLWSVSTARVWSVATA